MIKAQQRSELNTPHDRPVECVHCSINWLKILMKVMALIFGQLSTTLSVQRRASGARISLGVLLQVVVMLLLLALLNLNISMT
jgi:hypothetical protein